MSDIYAFVVPHDDGHLRVTGEVTSVGFDDPLEGVPQRFWGLEGVGVVKRNGVDTAICLRRSSSVTVELVLRPLSDFNFIVKGEVVGNWFNALVPVYAGPTFNYNRQPRHE